MLGRFELVTKLATGGMAELFLARERGLAGLERLVVIKRILPHLADNPSFIEMFLREARIIARLNHPNVVQIYELGEENGSYYIAMEYIHGSTVREMQVLAERDGVELPVEVAVSVIDRACRGLHAAHELRDLEGNPLELIHRDVSPHNLMCTTEGFVKVLDFGVAKASQGIEATNSGHLKGKFAYMSPEQCKGLKLDRRADIFALGIVLWEALTGRRLFKREKDLDMMRAVVQEDAEPPSLYNPAVPEAIDQVVLKALFKDRDQRYETAEQLRSDLLKACRASGLAFGEDVLTGFLSRIAGRELAERQSTMQDALERSLTSNERRALLHVTGSDSRSQVSNSGSDQDHLATVVERPGQSTPGSGSHGGLRRSPTGSGSVPGLRRSPTGSGSVPGLRRSPTGSGSLPPGIRPFDESDSGSYSQPNAQSDLRTTATLTEDGRDPGFAPQSFDDTPEANRTWWWVSGALAMIAIAAVVAWPAFKDSATGQKLFGKSQKHGPILIGDPLRVGWAPIATPKLLRDEIKPIRTYLQKTLGRPVHMEVTDSYETLSQGVQHGKFDVAMLPPFLYVKTKAEEPRIKLVALRQFGGATSSDGLLLTRMDSSVRSLDDLKGKTFCFTDHDSTTGNVLPHAYIRRQGHDPKKFIGKEVWSGNHLQVLRDLLAGKCDAAATYSGSFLTAGKFGIPVGKIRQLAITGHVPQDTVVVPPGTPDSQVKKLRKALLDFDPEKDAGVKVVGDILQITGFSKGVDAAFDDLRQALAQTHSLPKGAKLSNGKAPASP